MCARLTQLQPQAVALCPAAFVCILAGGKLGILEGISIVLSIGEQATLSSKLDKTDTGTYYARARPRARVRADFVLHTNGRGGVKPPLARYLGASGAPLSERLILRFPCSAMRGRLAVERRARVRCTLI